MDQLYWDKLRVGIASGPESLLKQPKRNLVVLGTGPALRCTNNGDLVIEMQAVIERQDTLRRDEVTISSELKDLAQEFKNRYLSDDSDNIKEIEAVRKTVINELQNLIDLLQGAN